MKSFSKIIAVLLLSSFGLTAHATPEDIHFFGIEQAPTNDKRIAFEELPIVIQDFINTHFASHQAIEIEQKRWPSRNGKMYEIDLTGKVELEFDKDGDWLEIETPRRSAGIPEAILPAGIKAYVNDKFPQEKVTSIEKKRYGFKIELANDLDIKFNKQGEFLTID